MTTKKRAKTVKAWAIKCGNGKIRFDDLFSCKEKALETLDKFQCYYYKTYNDKSTVIRVEIKEVRK